MKKELSYPQFYLLHFLSEHGPTKMSELKEHLAVTGAGITGLVDHLIKKGLITRQYSRTDRRVVHAIITDQGRTVLNEIIERRREFLAALFSRMDDTEQHLVEETFTILLSKLQEYEGT